MSIAFQLEASMREMNVRASFRPLGPLLRLWQFELLSRVALLDTRPSRAIQDLLDLYPYLKYVPPDTPI